MLAVAYLILFIGFITFLAGALVLLMLLFEEVAKTGRVPFRYDAMMVNTRGCVIWLTESKSRCDGHHQMVDFSSRIGAM